jgi:hypothetical protein
VFVALTEWGIINTTDDPVMMLDHQASGTGVALLGALTAAPSDAIYELKIDAVGYAGLPPPQVAESTFFKIVPEPGALWLLVAMSLGLRPSR